MSLEFQRLELQLSCHHSSRGQNSSYHAIKVLEARTPGIMSIEFQMLELQLPCYYSSRGQNSIYHVIFSSIGYKSSYHVIRVLEARTPCIISSEFQRLELQYSCHQSSRGQRLELQLSWHQCTRGQHSSYYAIRILEAKITAFMSSQFQRLEL